MGGLGARIHGLGAPLPHGMDDVRYDVVVDGGRVHVDMNCKQRRVKHQGGVF